MVKLKVPNVDEKIVLNPIHHVTVYYPKDNTSSSFVINTDDIDKSYNVDHERYSQNFTLDIKKSNKHYEEQLENFLKKSKPINWKKESIKYIQLEIKESHAIIQVINDGKNIKEVIVDDAILTNSERANLELFARNGCFKVHYISRAKDSETSSE